MKPVAMLLSPERIEVARVEVELAGGPILVGDLPSVLWPSAVLGVLVFMAI